MQARKCSRCGADTLMGDSDSYRAAVPYRISPQPLTAAGELSALQSGRLCRTWTLHAGGHVHPRTADTIRSRPAGRTMRQTVHADHVCGQGDA
jgi:hypothetical protein